MLTDQLAHERGHGIGIERFAPPAGEDQATVVIPGSSSGQPFLILLTLMLAQYSDGFAVNTDDPRPATFGGALDALATHTAVDPPNVTSAAPRSTACQRR